MNKTDDYGRLGPHTGGLRISEWAIKNPTPVTLLFIVAVLVGMFSFTSLPIKIWPNVEFPLVGVTVTRSGAAPAEMENQVVRPIENALNGITDVDAISTSIDEGLAVINIQFRLGADLQKATDDVRTKVDQVRNQLPNDIDPPRVSRLDAGNRPIDTYAVAAPGMSEADLSWLIDDKLSRVLQAVPGVAQVARLGGVDREINVIVDPEKLAAHGLTAAAVNQALTQYNVDFPGGRVLMGGQEQTLRVLGAAPSVDAIRNLSIPAGGDRFVRLSDVADVGDGAAEKRTFALLNGQPVVGFEVMKIKDASEISTEDGVNAALKKFEQENPSLKIKTINSQVDYTREDVAATQQSLLEGMLLAALVVWLFLRDWRATLITAVAMPVSLIPTFAFMALMHFSLNMVTLLGLTLVIGILVDDAIVEIENIEKRVFIGIRPYLAALWGADQIGLAVVATTFAIVAVFLPVGFMPGIPGQFFREFGITVAAAVMFSLVVARLLTPLLAAYFLAPKHARPRKPLPRFYTDALQWALERPIISSAAGFGVFAFTILFLIFGGFKFDLQPQENPNYYFINVEAPPNATLDDSRRVVDQLTAVLRKHPETEATYAQVGLTSVNGGPGGQLTSTSGPGQGAVAALLRPDHKESVADIKNDLRGALRAIPDARLSFDSSNWGAASVSVVLTSDTGDGLDAAAQELMREMNTVKGIADPRPVTPPNGAELVVRPRQDEASRLGVSAASIASVARVATLGDIDANVAKLDEGERRIPIRVRLPAADRQNLSVIRDLRVPTASGGFTTLGSVADVYFRAGPAQINRFDRKRNLTISADLVGDTGLRDAQMLVNKLPIMQHLPPGVSVASQGQEKAQAQLFGGFLAVMLAVPFLVYGVMVLLFRSFFKPLIVLSALPTALFGALIALRISDMAISIPSLIGFLMLMGLSSKNSILLVEYAIEREREGMSTRDALLEACRERARPIVMTSLAMMAGMAPTALAFGKGAEFRQPMAIGVIGGLISSTVISLVLVPAVYEVVSWFEHKITPILGKLVTPKSDPEEAPQPRPAPVGLAAE
jgi:hydrophobic/amphiphilic exporter-1 (mainly G- bacteria), HAE1 family